MSNDTKQVIIVDYQLGNMFSVRHACRHVGMNVKLSSKPSDIDNASALILPGVGAFRQAMEHIHRLKLYDVIRESIVNGKPFFGVCLGLQLLFDESEEFGVTKGFGLIPGSVTRLNKILPKDSAEKIPHVGWNEIRKKNFNDWTNTSLCKIEEGSHFYFVHSFVVQPVQNENILCMTEYGGIEFVSGIKLNNNVIATQFHPEKSGKKGLQLYKNWAEENSLI
ncbi:imidazole glycerol phosphate synthase subunit HisH [Verrucomicrobia bacterium]|nr:imidazole glycerol phosphate synthase subunit HisH [Verrucomicrobiota bacterium]